MTEPPEPGSLLDRHFDGDLQLFEAFRAASALQFKQDLAEGDAALQHGDSEALRRIGHDLKTVLELLDDVKGSAHARELEQLAKSATPGDAGLSAAWQALRPSLFGRD